MSEMTTATDRELRVYENLELDARHRLLLLEADEALASFRPGQFVMLGCGDGLLLRRPFSIQQAVVRYGIPCVEILYRVVGAGTAALARLRDGDQIPCLGPLGKGFTPPLRGELPILLGGGVGIPPMVALARALMELGGVEPLVIGGVGGVLDIACLSGLRELPFPIQVSTLDGSEGVRGTVLDALDLIWDENPPPRARVYTCGPTAMLAAVAAMAVERSLPCEVSVEARMGCGFGACVGCAVPRSAPRLAGGATRYALVCKEGPVFDAEDLDLALMKEMD